jgi:alkylation response protein AidB-like acyl-CoA dehydrogenase
MMHVALTFDQLARRDATASFLAAACTTADVRATWHAPTAVSRERWRGLADLGLTSLTIPESLGGLGATDLDLVVLLEEAGYVALPEPVSAAAAAAALLAEVSSDAAARWLPGLVSGAHVVTLGLSTEPYVAHADAADVIVSLDDAAAVRVLEPRDVRLAAQPGIDGSWRMHRVEQQRAVVPLACDPKAAARATARAALYAAAELVGVGRRSLDESVAYAKQRHQFGRPIGSYQALKHRLADDWIALEFARPLVWRAAWSIAHDVPDATLHVSAAKAAAGDAALRAARSAVHVHGALGYTFECDVQLFVKRALTLAATHGSARAHRRRIASVLRTRDLVRAP